MDRQQRQQSLGAHMSVPDPRVITVVLTWNDADCIDSCLKSLAASHHKTEVILIDNSSSDDTRSIVSENFPHIQIVNTRANLGYAGGNNVGIRHAINRHADYIFILNPDAAVDPDCIGRLVLRLQADTKLAGASPMIYQAGGTKVLFAGSAVHWHSGVTTDQDGDDTGQFSEIRYTDRLNGCAMILRSSVAQHVGLMDERFFIYYEETDWSVRLRKAGFDLAFVPDAHVWHGHSSSTGGFRNPLYHYYMTRNKLLFVRKHRPYMLPIVMVFVSADSIFRILVTLRSTTLKHAFSVARFITKGWIDFMTGHFNKCSNHDFNQFS